ncbi:MAG TPA: LytTR family DNA-binding domain-containing protein [Bacteroidia bacterium]|nr:LytTR family DNA-binding domain-containing protein [Bacteroidia bacterium]
MTFILVSGKTSVYPVQDKDIIRLQANGSYCIVFCKKGEQHVCSKNLKSVLGTLPPALFVRVHQSHAVRISEIKFWEKGRGGSLTLKDGSVIPVSYRMKKQFTDKLKK